ncbi:type II secretion system protein [Polaromonas sp.]|uniref:type II secretion system protein n=1 Tax=Polaromonas sp. TaxID=1869339 RepID=UPI00326316B1
MNFIDGRLARPRLYARACHRSQIRGFTYLGLLILVAIIGIVSTATLQLGSLVARRAAEEELLAIGAEFQAALSSYATATPSGQKRTPTSLNDLLRDPRYPGVRRHLRKLYSDPITGKDEWGIVQMGSEITGIYSLSNATPIKQKNFEPEFIDFEDTTTYQAWKFLVPPEQRAPARTPSPAITSRP